ncbi:MAG TPA: UDP-N-acetylglucosamine pyrophosphorylase [Clostridia bacterium]|jgi:NDP-sugar pyrophosphorylase family protein|nr:UDP-N-acetylglucosamine pyrophosphorylase [Clostridia bacterium]HPY43121.1 UDP-N-acetylglucosamine pyrophosphorylase [Clostridia bacterium]HQA98172.1 UDP-N-acetylglucosamine pyrophosphorylase [Clostridia bacterium]HQO56064.1 UDP-N-acetylglucosamine pyrophosphorylase [Clostridia bacterium]HUM60552.1 UDP-N-acetylglucosamine pyrophosphorylase [Clostridia bacterium]
MLRVTDLYDLSHSLAGEWLAGFTYPHEALEGIADCIRRLGAGLDPKEYHSPAEAVWIHKTATVAPSAAITGPCIIGPGSEVRHCAYIRGSALVGAECVVGNSTELKNVILFDRVQVPHYNYVGDSILGYRAHMGAGSITSNVKSDRQPVVLRDGQERLPTQRKKIGALIGDHVEVGCNAVLNPGTILGRGASVYPTASVRGTVPENHIHKLDGSVVKRS